MKVQKITFSSRCPKGPADDGKRSEAEWTLCNAGIEERGVPGGEGTGILPDRRVADDGKRSEAEWTLCVNWNKRRGWFRRER